jgi:hypothetical protein
LLATTLWEGTANLAADAREAPGEGPYVSMWRDRYVRNLTPERLGATYFQELFVRPPTRFIRDYLALCEADSTLPRFSTNTRRVIESLPASW